MIPDTARTLVRNKIHSLLIQLSNMSPNWRDAGGPNDSPEVAVIRAIHKHIIFFNGHSQWPLLPKTAD